MLIKASYLLFFLVLTTDVGVRVCASSGGIKKTPNSTSKTGGKKGGKKVATTCGDIAALWEQKIQEELELIDYATTLHCSSVDIPYGDLHFYLKKNTKKGEDDKCYDVLVEYAQLLEESKYLQAKRLELHCTDEKDFSAANPENACTAYPDPNQVDPFSNNWDNGVCCSNRKSCKSECCVFYAFIEDRCGDDSFWNLCYVGPPLGDCTVPTQLFGNGLFARGTCCVSDYDCEGTYRCRSGGDFNINEKRCRI
mmetsp:Transcript_15825/g.43637  ORF Transcript_15825/g.43637 Transcript_15825/m.43637 type:complete len:252 (-) Transcript_15825:330-1085(-)